MKKPFVFLSLFTVISSSILAQDATALYEEGLKLKNDKKIRDAVDKFRQATELKSNYTEALYELGWCRNDLKDYSGALQALRPVMPVWPSTLKNNFEYAYALDKLNKTDSAVIYYNKCLEIKPDYSGVYKQLAFIAYQKEDYPTAISHFNKCESYASTPVTDYLYWYRKGYCQNTTKDYSGAKVSLQKSIDAKKDYLNSWLEIGFAATKLKEDDIAIGYFQKAIELDPKSHIGYNGVAEVYRDIKKDMPQAMNWYQKTLAMNSNERKANFGMGYCLNSTAKYSEAITYLKKAIEMETTYTAAYVELGYSYYMNSNNTDALISLDKALALNPKNENARYYKGLIYINKKDKGNAQKMADELTSLGSKNAATLQEKINKM